MWSEGSVFIKIQNKTCAVDVGARVVKRKGSFLQMCIYYYQCSDLLDYYRRIVL